MRKYRKIKAVKENFIGRSFMTKYNQRIYRIDDVDFDKNPESTFFMNMHNKNKEISYKDYLLENYQIKIQDLTQPLLVHHVRYTNQVIYLVPEVCALTGITEYQKSKNFREIKADMFANAQQKEMQAQNFFNILAENREEWYSNFTAKWGLKLERKRLPVTAYVCKRGSILCEKDKILKIKDLKPGFFSQQFSAPHKWNKIEKWAILYGSHAEQEKTVFVSGLRKCMEREYKVFANAPDMIKVNNEKDITSWSKAIADPDYEIVV